MYLLSWQKPSKPKDDNLGHLQKFQMSKHSMILVTMKTRSRLNLWHAIRGLIIIHLRYKYHVCTSNGYWLMDIWPSNWFLLEKFNLGPKNPELRTQWPNFWYVFKLSTGVDMEPLGPVASIFATPANRQTDGQKDGWTDRWKDGC